jgi:hypothetical protein
VALKSYRHLHANGKILLSGNNDLVNLVPANVMDTMNENEDVLTVHGRFLGFHSVDYTDQSLYSRKLQVIGI